MPQTCTICKHPERAAIEAALVQGRSLRDIARHFGVKKDSVARHRRSCMPEELSKAQAAREEVLAINVQEQIAALNAITVQSIAEAREAVERCKAAQADAVPSEEELLALDKERRALRLKLSGIHSWRRNQEYTNALQAIDRAMRQLETQAKLQGDLQQEGTINLWVNPEWVSVRTLLLTTLRPFPEARAAVAEALLRLEAEAAPEATHERRPA